VESHDEQNAGEEVRIPHQKREKVVQDSDSGGNTSEQLGSVQKETKRGNRRDCEIPSDLSEASDPRGSPKVSIAQPRLRWNDSDDTAMDVRSRPRPRSMACPRGKPNLQNRPLNEEERIERSSESDLLPHRGVPSQFSAARNAFRMDSSPWDCS
jgi:hypothetical protein